MDRSTLYLIAADAILLLHVLLVAFNVLCLFCIIIGKIRRWSWVRNPWFRWLHLMTIGIITLQAWLGLSCPLTTLEISLRTQTGSVGYTGTFITHLLETLLYYNFPAWVFIVCYTLFATLVAASWFWIRPRSFTKPPKNQRTPPP